MKKVRQVIESVNDTLKGQLDLEDPSGRSFAGVAIRVAQCVLAMVAAIWQNHAIGAPVTRSLIAYDLWLGSPARFRGVGWFDVDDGQFVLSVAVQVGGVPALTAADSMKPERGVGFVRVGDEAHRSRRVELVDQPAHHPGQRDAVHEQNPLVALPR
ncbi:hypothetical protein ACIG56_27300 [Nocardia fusca]|uniref:hypothetical protein n=1 Tax=Nocardia fusca TaxID=941183 RepID=UPI0037CBEBC7